MSGTDIVRVNQEYKEKALAQEWENIRDDKQAVIDRIKTMIVGTRKLADAEVFSLAVYAITNNLNPFAGECYFIDGVGVVPGVAGLRRKAREQLDREAKIAKMDGAQFAIEYSLATHEEAVFEDGDVAWKAVLTDTVSQSKWLGDLLSTTKLLQGLFPGVGFSELMAKAEEITGKKPTWWAVGVVSKDESFSKLEYENGKPTGSRKPEMWDRNERAKKRAAKNAIRQRFDIIIPDYLMNGASGGYDMDEPVISISIPQDDNPQPQEQIAPKTQSTNANSVEFDAPLDINNISKSVINEIMRLKLAGNPMNVANALKLSVWLKQPGRIERDAVSWMMCYRANRNAGAESDSAAFDADNEFTEKSVTKQSSDEPEQILKDLGF